MDTIRDFVLWIPIPGSFHGIVHGTQIRDSYHGIAPWIRMTGSHHGLVSGAPVVLIDSPSATDVNQNAVRGRN